MFRQIRDRRVSQLGSMAQFLHRRTFDFFCLIHSEAVETRHALHGIQWPPSNPKTLNVDFGNEQLMAKAIASTAVDVRPAASSRDDRIGSSGDPYDTDREKVSCTLSTCNSTTSIHVFICFAAANGETRPRMGSWQEAGP